MEHGVGTGPDRHPQGDGEGQVVVLVYDGVAADEAGAVVTILVEAGMEVAVASVDAAAPTSYHGRVVPTRSLADLGPCPALVVPGGMGVRRAAADPRLAAAIVALADRATWLAATSTGSVLLGAAGVIDGASAATHWLAAELLGEWGVTPRDESFVEHGRLLTASGPASAAQIGFRLVGALRGAAAEEESRRRYEPRPRPDPRYRPREPFWRSLGRRRIEPLGHDLDPTGAAEIILLDLEPDGP